MAKPFRDSPDTLITATRPAGADGEVTEADVVCGLRPGLDIARSKPPDCCSASGLGGVLTKAAR
eukprot:2582-Eustigmatos_ZCMA.PRE.1